MNNLEFYEKGRDVPAEAKKQIGAGRLKGMTDINPMWRIKKLTEMFGPVGLGWKPEIVKRELISSPETKEIAAFVDINLYVKYDGVGGEWSDPIPGTGGSSFVAVEKGGLHMCDECFKMAYTDAISVAAKAIGIGASVYWDKDKTKYTTPAPAEVQKDEYLEGVRKDFWDKVTEIIAVTGRDKKAEAQKLCEKVGVAKPATAEDFDKLLMAAEALLRELYESEN